MQPEQSGSLDRLGDRESAAGTNGQSVTSNKFQIHTELVVLHQSIYSCFATLSCKLGAGAVGVRNLSIGVTERVQ